MSLNAKQLKDFIIIPSLDAIGLNSASAVKLLMLTAATESHLGTYVRQVGMSGNRGAFGIYQMEERTYNDIWERIIIKDQLLKSKVFGYTNYYAKPPVQRLMTDLALATIMTRLHYFQFKDALPDANDIQALAVYWKEKYNSYLGKGKPEEAIANYKKYCG